MRNLWLRLTGVHRLQTQIHTLRESVNILHGKVAKIEAKLAPITLVPTWTNNSNAVNGTLKNSTTLQANAPLTIGVAVPIRRRAKKSVVKKLTAKKKPVKRGAK